MIPVSMIRDEIGGRKKPCEYLYSEVLFYIFTVSYNVTYTTRSSRKPKKKDWLCLYSTLFRGLYTVSIDAFKCVLRHTSLLSGIPVPFTTLRFRESDCVSAM